MALLLKDFESKSEKTSKQALLHQLGSLRQRVKELEAVETSRVSD